MSKIEAKQIIGKWRSYKQQYNDKEKMQDGGNWTEWTFQDDGKAKFLLSTENKLISDYRDRFWTIKELELDGVTTYHLNINDQSEYEILSVDKSFLVLKSSNGIIYHFADMLKWYDVIK